MSTNAHSNKAAGEDLEKWIAAALVARKAMVRPRVGFDELAKAAGVSRRTAIRHLGSEQRGTTTPHIPTGPLYGYTQALGTTIDAMVREAMRLRDEDAASKAAQEREAAQAMTSKQHRELKAAQEAVRGKRATRRKEA